MGYRIMRLPRRLSRALQRLTDRSGSAGRPLPGGQVRPSRSGPVQARAKGLTAELTALPPIRPRPSRPGIRAAVAAGDRVLIGLAWEWDQRSVLHHNWEEVLAQHSPHLLLIEIVDGMIPGWGKARDADALNLGRAAKRAGVPVVLWVTAGDDPDQWAPLAESADVVFVAHPGMGRSWQAGRPSRPLETLGPAAQPRLYSPELGLPGGRDLGACVILESDRQAPMTSDVLSPLIAPAVQPLGQSELDIWRVGATSDRGSLPQSLRPRELGLRPYDQMVRALGRYAVFVDAGAHDPRWTWPILEAGAARAAVVSLADHAEALPADIGAYVAAADEAKSLRSEIVARLRQPELRDRESAQLHRAVLDRHTYAHRVDTILEHLGLAGVRSPAPTVSAVVPTNRTHEIENILENIGRQSHDQVELVLVLHGIEPDLAAIQARAHEIGIDQLIIRTVDASHTLGACMNVGIEAAAGTYIAKMDDDNFYGRHYLTDLVRAFTYTEAGIVGKWAHYVWLRSSGAVVLRYPSAEHTYERRVQGGSMLIDGGVARKLRFNDQPRAVDSELLDRAAAEGIQIYSADRFNFVSIRDVAPETHTWKVADSTFMTSSGRLVFFGDPRPHVDV